MFYFHNNCDINISNKKRILKFKKFLVKIIIIDTSVYKLRLLNSI